MFKTLAAAIILISSANAFAYEINDAIWKDVPSPSHISVYLYPVYSKNFDSVHKEMLASGPMAENGSAHYAAAKWKIEWSWPLKEGIPHYKNFKLNAVMSLTLPVAQDIKLKQSARWKKFMHEMILHELQHLEHARLLNRKASDMISAFPAEMDVKEANKQINALVRDIRRLDLDYDKRTQHGLSEGISLKAE